MKPQIDNFKLTKVKIDNSTGTVHAEYSLQLPEGQEVLNIDSKSDYSYLPHKDLTDVLEKYKPMLATNFYYDLTRKGEVDNIMSKIEVRGITLTGKEKTKGVKIFGVIKSENNIPLVLNSENLRYNSTKYGFEDSFQELEDALITEVYAFIFEDKKGQLKLFQNAEFEEGEEITDAQEEQQ